MNAAHLHLILVHIPIVAVPLMTAILCYGIKRKSPELIRTTLVILFLSALITIPAYLAGEGAEEIVEHFPGIVEDNIEKHEDAALYAFIAVLLNGALSFVALFWARMRPAAAVLAVVSSLLLFWTGNLGGNIRHAEEINRAIDAKKYEAKK